MTVDEWTQELERLRFAPGSGIRRRFWTAQLRYLNGTYDGGRHPRPLGLTKHSIRRLSVRERAELYEDLAPDATVTGFITRFGGVAQVDHGRRARSGQPHDHQVRVY
jgi:hypothetical protein